MKKRTRVFTQILAALMLFAFMTGCGPKTENPTSDSSTGLSGDDTTAPTTERDTGFEIPVDPITTEPGATTAPTTKPQPVIPKKDPITLTYASWADREMQEYLVARFEEIYDWIDVELIQLDQSSWSTGLFNLASSGDLPDAYCTFYLATSASSGWAKDITEIYNNDPYTKMIPKDMQGAGVYNGVRYGLVLSLIHI